MKRRHIAIVSPGGKAHTYPSLGICPELVKRGWRVTYATDKSHTELVRETGADPVPFTSPDVDTRKEWAYPTNLPPSHPAWWCSYGKFAYPFLVDRAAAVVQQLSGFFDENPPDLLLYDRIAFAGRIFARRANCPAIQMYPHFAPLENFLYWENGVCRSPQPLLDFAESLDLFLRSFGIDQKNNLWHIESLNIFFIPREFQYQSELFDDRYCFIGPCLNRPIRHCWKNNSNGKPIILISDMAGLGDPAYFRLFVDALSQTKYHIILSMGDEIPDSELKLLPENFEINRFASHLEILPHASLLVCQGGTGSTLEAIYHGVPAIVLPLNPDHEAWAYRLVEMGVGIRLPRHTASVDMIRNGIESALADSRLLGRVAQMRQIVSNCGGAAMAADKIEQCLRATGSAVTPLQ